MNLLNKIDPASAGNMLNDTLFNHHNNDENNTKNIINNYKRKEETRNKTNENKNKKLPIKNPGNSKLFVKNKYFTAGDNNNNKKKYAGPWSCKTCGRSNRLAKFRCATCKSKKEFSV